MSIFSKIGSVVGGIASAAGNVMSTVPGLNVLGSAIGQGGNLLSGLSASYEQGKQNNATRQLSWDLQKDAQKFNSSEALHSWQRGEKSAELARQFNSVEAAKAREFELAMWKRANEYNSPANQLRLLQAAGYNPNVFQPSVSAADGSLSSPLASSSPASSSPASSPLASSPLLPNPAMVDAQVRLANAQTEKLESETRTDSKNYQYIDALAQGQVDLNNTQVFLNISKESESKAVAKKLFADIYKQTFDIQNLNANTAYIRANTDLTKQKEIRETFENSVALDRLAKEIDRIESEIKKNNAQITLFNSEAQNSQALAKYYLQLCSNAVLEGGTLGIKYAIDNETKQARIDLIKTASDQAQLDLDFTNFNLEYDKRYRRSNELMQMGSNVLNSIGGVVQSSVISYGIFKGLKAPKMSTPPTTNSFNKIFKP